MALKRSEAGALSIQNPVHCLRQPRNATQPTLHANPDLNPLMALLNSSFTSSSLHERQRAFYKNKPRHAVPSRAGLATRSRDPQLSVPSWLNDPKRETGKTRQLPFPPGRTRSDKPAGVDGRHGSHAGDAEDGAATGALEGAFAAAPNPGGAPRRRASSTPTIRDPKP